MVFKARWMDSGEDDDKQSIVTGSMVAHECNPPSRFLNFSVCADFIFVFDLFWVVFYLLFIYYSMTSL